jgi:hypothetical protein
MAVQYTTLRREIFPIYKDIDTQVGDTPKESNKMVGEVKAGPRTWE